VDGPEEASAVIGLHLGIPGAGGILVVQPPPAELAIGFDEVENWIEDALRQANAQHVTGGAVTPFVLSRVAERSGGRTLTTNIGLIVNNARTAARIAVALASA
jgi:pseudouridine-5'-phosphate glycosidase